MKLKTLVMITFSCCAFATTQYSPVNPDYKKWWDEWYAHGQTSGPGSRGFLAQYKAEVINEFIRTHSIQSAIEFGCGDGYNLALISYPEYIGLDISPTSVRMCEQKFKNDPTKQFMHYIPASFVNKGFKTVDLVLCIDVLYHVLEEQDYVKTLDDIFSFNAPYVILYTTLTEKWNGGYAEIFHRNVLTYLAKYCDYSYTVIENKYKDVQGGSSAAWIFLTRNK